MESCGGAHHWACELIALSHDVRLIPPQYVKPYVKRGKNDRHDAETICEADGSQPLRRALALTHGQNAQLRRHWANVCGQLRCTAGPPFVLPPGIPMHSPPQGARESASALSQPEAPAPAVHPQRGPLGGIIRYDAAAEAVEDRAI